MAHNAAASNVNAIIKVTAHLILVLDHRESTFAATCTRD